MHKFKLPVIFLLLLINYSLTFASPQNQQKNIKIASGGIMKSYYEVAMKLCSFIEKSNPGLKCEVVETTGSLENLKLLKAKKVDFAFSQSDIALDAFGGVGFYETPSLELRQVLNLYDEIFTIISKDDDHIKTFADIAGKRITNGPNNSGSSITYNAVRSLYDFIPPIDLNLNPEEYAQKLCNGEIEAVILVLGHPNKIVNHIANSCNVEFVTIETEQLSKLMEQNKAYRKVTLHKDTYPQISQDQQTAGVAAILVTNEDMDDKVIKNFMSYFKKHIIEFKQSNFMLENLSDEHFTNDFVLPVHEKLMKKQ